MLRLSWSGLALSTQLGSLSNVYVHSSLLLHGSLVSVGVPYSSLRSSSLKGRFFETKGWAAGFMLAMLTKIGMVTGGGAATVLTKVEPWNFTDGTFSGTVPLASDC